MKKALFLLTAVIGLASSQLPAQTITVDGSSHSNINPGDTFSVTISLSVADLVGCGDGDDACMVTALNLLLATPSSGAGSAVGFFTVQFDDGGTGFPTRIGTGASSTFDTAGSGTNTGFTVTNPGNDLGAAGPGVAAPFSGVTAVFLNFTVAANAPAGTYDFRATLGGSADGSFINIGNPAVSQGDSFDVTNAPTFQVTVVPEPSTWALMAFGGLAALGMAKLRRRKS